MGQEREKPVLSTIHLENAVLCVECEMISDSPHDTCPVCGSRSLISLSRVLGGTLPMPRIRLLEAAAKHTDTAPAPLVLHITVPYQHVRH